MRNPKPKKLRKSIFRKTAVIFVIVALVPVTILGLRGQNYYSEQLEKMVDAGVISREDADNQSQDLKEQSFIYMGYGLAIALVLGYFFASSLVRPIRSLEQGARRIGDGNLDFRIGTDTDDELEDLAATINQMAASLQSREMEIFSRNRDLSILYELTHAMSESRDLSHLFSHALEQALWVAGSDSGCILIREEDNLFSTKCVGTATSSKDTRPSGDIFADVANAAIDSREPALLAHDSQQYDFDSVVAIPLRFEDRWQGAICTTGKKKNFQRETMELLAAIGSEVAMAIENTRLFEKLESQNVELGLATKEIANLFAKAERNKSFNTRYENPHLVSCWEQKNCDKTDCPAHGLKTNLRCWQVAGTHCGGEVQGVFAQKLGRCEKCEVFNLACPDKITLMGETFNNMMAILEQRVTEQDNLQRQLYSSSKLAAIGELAAGVAHEINNPLTGILGSAMLMKSQPLDREEMEKKISIIESETLRARDIVRNLLDFAHQGNHMEREKIPVEKLIEQTLFLVRHQARSGSVTISTSFEHGLPPVAATGNQMKQVFMNIIHNAIHSMEPEGRLLISTRMSASGQGQSMIEVCFTDSGAGIGPDDLSRIFDPFFTTKRVGEGTGLGLSVSQRIVNEHGGEIKVESKLGKGSTFIVALPAASTTKESQQHVA